MDSSQETLEWKKIDFDSFYLDFEKKKQSKREILKNVIFSEKHYIFGNEEANQHPN